MNIQCTSCGTQHELEPPIWVVSSGRPFLFRCSSCGHPQRVNPEPAVPSPVGSLPEDPSPPKPTPVIVSEVAETVAPQSSAVVPEAAPAESEPAPSPLAELDTPIRLGREHSPALPPVRDEVPSPKEEKGEVEPVFLKQNGQIFTVQGWDVLKLWIKQRRVDRHDMVSEGGVRWEFVDSRPDLMGLFASSGAELASLPPTPEPTPFPFADGPFGGSGGWHDDDTEGIPTGLPPLPTEEQIDDEEAARLLPSGLQLIERTDSSEEVEAPTGLAMIEDLTPAPVPRALLGEAAHSEEAFEDSESEVTWPVGHSRPGLSTPAPAPVSAPPPTIGASTEDDEIIQYVSPSELIEQVKKTPEPAVTSELVAESAKEEDWADFVSPDPDRIATTPSSPRRESLSASEPNTVPKAPSAPTFIDDPSDEGEFQSSNHQSIIFAALGLGVLIVLCAVGVGFGGLFGAGSATHPPAPDLPSQPALRPADPAPATPAPATPEPVAPEPATPEPAAPEPAAPEPAAPEPATPEPATPEPAAPEPATPEPAAPEPVTPEPAEPAKPEPAKPEPVKPQNVSKLVDEGWNLADRSPTKALALFNQAVAASPGHGLAWYGKGYVLLRKGDKAGAKSALCKARTRLRGGDRAEVDGLLSSSDLSCP